MDNYINDLDVLLQANHLEFYKTLRSGRDISSRYPTGLRKWFSWKDGSRTSVAEVFHGSYFFCSHQEGLDIMDSMHENNWMKKMVFRCINGMSATSMPLVIDNGGGGYYYDLKNESIKFFFEGERTIVLEGIHVMIKILTKMAEFGCHHTPLAVEAEFEMLECARNGHQ